MHEPVELQNHDPRRSDVFERGGARIDFCERLRRDTALRAQNRTLKVRGLARVGGDRELYTAAKEPFIRNSILAQLPADPQPPGFSRPGDPAGIACQDLPFRS